MNKEIKEKWLDALRSGFYQKGKGALITYEHSGIVRYCCLGILATILNKPVSNGALKEDIDNKTRKTGLYHSLQIACDFDNKQAWQLAILNDTKETFAEVIEYIEKNL